jgi:hypothetical protein
MRTFPLSLVVTLLVAVACSPEREPESVSTAELPAAASAPPACPAADFAGFFAAFAEDTALQRRWTVFPLESSAIDNAGPEPTEQVDTLTAAEATFPLVPSAAQREADGREIEIENAEGGGRQVNVFKPDTDWTTDFVFVPAGGCWRLVRIADRSL